jgi:hypothetical protein
MLFVDKEHDGDAWNQEEDIWRWLSLNWSLAQHTGDWR